MYGRSSGRTMNRRADSFDFCLHNRHSLTLAANTGRAGDGRREVWTSLLPGEALEHYSIEGSSTASLTPRITAFDSRATRSAVAGMARRRASTTSTLRIPERLHN